jgi:hypothetical protein
MLGSGEVLLATSQHDQKCHYGWKVHKRERSQSDTGREGKGREETRWVNFL